jgi:pimeloyl-ACP methyl ester carboxylesterase
VTPSRIVAWSPMTAKRWPPRQWIGAVTRVAGTRIFARIAPGAERDAAPILMLHGLVVSSSYFRPVAHQLDERFALYIPDLPGFGRSTAGDARDLDGVVDALVAWMDIHGLRAPVVVGNSLGCQVATLLATRYPERVAALVMVAPTMDPAVSGPLGVIWRGMKDIPRERLGLWRIWVPDFLLAGPVRALRWLLISLRDDQLARLPAVRQPVVAVAGEDDPICPVAWVDAFAGAVADGRMVIIPGAPHAMNYSAPGALARVIAEAMEHGGNVSTPASRTTM